MLKRTECGPGATVKTDMGPGGEVSQVRELVPSRRAAGHARAAGLDRGAQTGLRAAGEPAAGRGATGELCVREARGAQNTPSTPRLSRIREVMRSRRELPAAQPCGPCMGEGGLLRWGRGRRPGGWKRPGCPAQAMRKKHANPPCPFRKGVCPWRIAEYVPKGGWVGEWVPWEREAVLLG